MNKRDTTPDATAAIDARIEQLSQGGDWRGGTLARVRALIHKADPAIVEEWKWMGTPVWSHDGIVCTGESYKNVVKLTFARGAALPDPSGLFNSSLEGNVRRAIDIRDGERVEEAAFQQLVRAAVALNTETKSKAKTKAKSKAKPEAKSKAKPEAKNKAKPKARSKAKPE